MKITKMDLSEERRILSQMIADGEFLRRIHSVADPTLFESAFARTVAGWVMEFYGHHTDAPERLIQDMYIQRRAELQDEDELDLVADFLSRLSRDWARAKPSNMDYAVDGAVKYFKLRALVRLKERIEAATEAGDADAGEQLVGDFRRVELPQGQGIRILHDVEAIREAFSREYEELFQFPGALGEVVGAFNRGDFVSYIAPAKRGKSWWLWYSAYRAALSGCKVVFVSLEMTKPQVIRRAWSCFTGLPEFAKDVTLPSFTDDGDIEYRTVKREGIQLTREAIKETQAKYRFACRGGEPRIEVFPSGGASIRELATMLDNLAFYEGWTPDVLVVDYADLMRPDDARLDYRHKLDAIWKGLRGLAQDRNIAVFTASQSSKATLSKDATVENVAEDYRKLTHVTHAITLNQTDAEMEKGIIRLQLGLVREGERTADQVVVLENRSIGRPYLDSRPGKSVISRDVAIKRETEDSAG